MVGVLRTGELSGLTLELTGVELQSSTGELVPADVMGLTDCLQHHCWSHQQLFLMLH